jgi:hypothetical protein
LLEYNNVCLAEGPWPTKAYYDAKQRARERDAGHYFNYGYTLPGIVSRGAYQQHQPGYNSTSFEESSTIQPSGGSDYMVPAFPTLPSGTSRMIETDSARVIPPSLLPNSGGAIPASLMVPTSATSPLVPSSARNMRYVQ